MEKREDYGKDNYGDETSRRRPFDQDAEQEYDEIYRDYMREHTGRERKSHFSEEDGINISSFSDAPKKEEAPKRKTARGGKGGKNKKKKALIITVACLLVIFGALIYYIWPFLNYNYRKITKNPDDLGFEYVISDKITNIALFGLDTRDQGDFTGRSDSIMILSLNTETKKVKVISLMRDTIVKMTHKGETFYSKLNNAYFYGGPELAIKTLNQNFGLDISNYATINFYGMIDIIDAVGGIEATITEDELTWQGEDMPNLNNCMEEICEEKGLNIGDYLISETGTQHLNGVQAVAYSRIRHCMSTFGTTDDFGRTDRQRHVMEQLFSKAITMKKTDYIRLARALLPCSETSLSFNEIVSLAIDVLLKSPTFVQCRVPQMEWTMSFNYPEYGSCVYFDMDYAKKAIHSIIYEDMTVDEFVEQNPIQKNDWFAAIYGTPAATPPEDLPELPDGSSSSSSGFESSSSSQNSSETSNGEISTPLDYEDGSSSGAESTQGGT